MEDLVDSSTDWSSSDSDLDKLHHDDDTEMMLLVLDMKEIVDRAKLLDRRRYQMHRSLFETIIRDCEANSDYF
jgi:hypothetical protein